VSYAFPLHIDWHCQCGDTPQSHVSRSDREECHGHCQGTPKKCAGQGYRPIPHSGRTPAITAIFNAAGEVGWPKHYSSDLSVDYKILMGWEGREPAPERFIWVLREMGTHLYPLQQDEQGQGIARGALRWLQSNHPEAHVFYWNGYTLSPANYDTVLTLAALPVRSRESYSCHGPTWHNGYCTHRAVSTAPGGDHTHGPGVMACTLCAPAVPERV
jgi:hypothetical protein